MKQSHELPIAVLEEPPVAVLEDSPPVAVLEDDSQPRNLLTDIPRTSEERAARDFTLTSALPKSGVDVEEIPSDPNESAVSAGWSEFLNQFGQLPKTLFGDEGDTKSVLGISPEKIPSGAQIKENTTNPQADSAGIPLAVGIPMSAAGKTAAGLAQFATSPKGITQLGASGIPVLGLAMRAKFVADMLKGGSEAAGSLYERLKKFVSNPRDVSIEDVQGIADDTVNGAAMLYGAKHLGKAEYESIASTLEPMRKLGQEFGKNVEQSTIGTEQGPRVVPLGKQGQAQLPPEATLSEADVALVDKVKEVAPQTGAALEQKLLEPNVAEQATEAGGGIPANQRPASAAPIEPQGQPEWLLHNIDTLSESVEKRGLGDKVEELAAQLLTANEIASRLGLQREEVMAVRLKRGIPSQTVGAGAAQSINPDFGAWLTKRQTLPTSTREVVSANAEPAQEFGGMGAAVPEKPVERSIGAATYGAIGGGNELKQLTENVASQLDAAGPASPKAKINLATSISDAFTKGKDALTSAYGKVVAGATALKNAYLNLPEWTNYKNSLGEWQLADQETAHNVRKWVNKIKEYIPDPLRREAITNWIQADGDATVLQDRANASSGALKRGYEAALTLNKDEQIQARNIQQYLEAKLQDGIDAGLLKGGLENYVTQIWDRDNPIARGLVSELGSGKLRPDFKFAKRRVFDSYFEGEQAGFKPLSKDIGTLIGVYDQAFNRSLSARAFVKQMMDGKTKTGDELVKIGGTVTPIDPTGAGPDAYLIKPSAMPKEPLTSDGRPYKRFDHPAFNDWRFAIKDADGATAFYKADAYVHPDVYQDISRALGSSALRSNPIGRGALQAAGFLKQSKLSLSPFHVVQEGIHALFHRVNPLFPKPLDFEAPAQRELISKGLIVSDANAQALHMEGLTGGGIVGKIPGLGKVQHAFNEWLFRDYIPRLKMTMAQHALDRNLTAYADELASGKITRDQIVALTAEQGNAAFGELNYKMLGRSPLVQDVLRLSLLAPDFLEARARFVGQALKPYGKEQRVALLLMAATLYTGARILNQLFDKEPHFDKPFEVVANGRIYKIRTLLGDVEHAAEDPQNFAFNRLSPYSRIAAEFGTGRDERGIKRSSIEQIGDFLKWFKPIAIDTKPSQSIANTIESSAGLGSRQYTAVQQMFELANKWKQQSTDPKVKAEIDRREKETYADSDYKGLITALTSEDTDAAKSELAKLLESKSKSTVIAYFNNGVNRPFTGNTSEESKFKKSLTPKQLETYNQAKQERANLRKSFLGVLR